MTNEDQNNLAKELLAALLQLISETSCDEAIIEAAKRGTENLRKGAPVSRLALRPLTLPLAHLIQGETGERPNLNHALSLFKISAA